MEKAWTGRFKDKTETIAEAFTSSVSFDRRLWLYDIEGSAAHVKMLKKQKIISSKDSRIILRSLSKIKTEIRRGKFQFSDALEDVHMNIESAVIKKAGKAGGKLHTARSRNDQVSLDLRLYLREEIKELQDLIKKLQMLFTDCAEKNIDAVLPGYTHLQKAQPVLLAHHLLSYFEMLGRDIERFQDCLKRTNILPLGSGALAGTTLPIDRGYVARLLRFPQISRNSMDAVSDRDFVIEFLSAASLLMVHLSRIAEELVLWSSDEFNFIELPEAYSTGSSIMPQKKNPDVPELVRGKAGRVFGNLLAVLVVMKALPLTYNRDLQEDKEPLFDSIDTVKSCLSVLAGMYPKIRFNKETMAVAAGGGFSTATDLAEYLVRKGMPFRNAHKITGKIVRYCIKNRKTLSDLSLLELKKYSKIIDKDIFRHISVAASISGKKSAGGTSKKEVLKRIGQIKRELKK